MPHYTVHPTRTGRWAVCQPVPGTSALSAVCDCADEATARQVASDQNAERELLAQLQQHFPAPRWRHTQAGPRAQHAATYARIRHLPEGLL